MTITIHQHQLVVTLTTMEKILSIRGDIRIPAAHIRSAWLGMPKSKWNELRIPGSFVPGLIKAGTYITPRGKEFWYVTRNKRHVLTIELEGYKPYARLVLGFENPEEVRASGVAISAPPAGIEIA